ncbi:hypothetical protein C2S51_033306 [Perilla frutescens var. frutescens]|nr:hypothetical protein C2S51_033306 [Perilla frutescens var. frutescens]
MAFRRSVTARAKILYQQQRIAVPFSHIDRDDNDRENLPRHNPIYKGSEIPDYLRRSRLLGAGDNVGSFRGSMNSFQDRRFAIPAAFAPVFVRNMSTLGKGSGADNIEIITDNIEIMTDVADVFGEKAVEVAAQVAPVVNEVAVAAADSFFPVAALQYVIDYVHFFTGLNWWASIVLTTVLIRTLQLPLTIHQIKATSKFTLLRPQLEEIQEEIKSRDMSPAAVAEGQARMRKLFNESGVTPFTPMKGLLIVGPVFCCFFLAINNMAEKVQSFKDGGAFWFTDLTTPDAMYILPVLTALTFWITVELNAQEGLEGNPAAGTIKKVSRVFAALTIPLTASFPKAIFCYWITSNLYSLAYGMVMKKPEVKKMLGIPDIPVPPPSPSTDQKQSLSFFESLKKYAESQQRLQQMQHQQKSLSPPTPADESSKPANPRIPSSSVLSQRIKSLEKEVKGRRKGKKRSN